MEPTARVFEGQDGQWYWHVESGGQIVATGGEGFTREADAWRAFFGAAGSVLAAALAARGA
jgi:hypothetical protein